MTGKRLIWDFLKRLIPADRPTSCQLTAYHEAGHAVAAMAFGIGFKSVSVVDDYYSEGRIILGRVWPHLMPGFNPHDPETRRIAEDWILLALAGESADAYHGHREPDFRSLEAKEDLRIAMALAEWLGARPGERDALLGEMQRRAHRFVREPLRWHQIAAVATRLGQLRELNRDQVGQIMDEIAVADESRGPA